MSIDSIITEALQFTLPTASSSIEQPSASSIDAFRAALEEAHPRPQDAALGVNATAPASGVSSEAAVALTPGDAILSKLERMSAGFAETLETVRDSATNVEPGEIMGAGDLLKAQFALTQVTLHHDLLSKVVGKGTQSLDTFLKNQ